MKYHEVPNTTSLNHLIWYIPTQECHLSKLLLFVSRDREVFQTRLQLEIICFSHSYCKLEQRKFCLSISFSTFIILSITLSILSIIDRFRIPCKAFLLFQSRHKSLMNHIRLSYSIHLHITHGQVVRLDLVIRF